jgi:hypothetical protein
LADEDLYRSAPRDEALAAAYGLFEHFNVMFGGNMGVAGIFEELHAG